MCTLSWFKTENGYELFFNRDEMKKRRRAELPEVYLDKNVEIISPTDADAGGTWISVNQFGVSFCLLNHYEKEQLIPHTDWLSRGEIIRFLASFSTLEKVDEQFQSFNLKKYRPFRLFIINAAGNSYFYTWDGIVSQMEKDIKGPRSSSSYEPDKVRKSRKLLFAKLGLDDDVDIADVRGEETADTANRKRFMDYHTSHIPDKSAYSVCMHRDNANSVSLSHIVVDAEQVSFSYADGQPCSVPLGDTLYSQRLDADSHPCGINAA